MRKAILSVLLVVGLTMSPGCGAVTAPPPTLSPAAAKAFKATQTIQILDLIRDVAVDANASKSFTGTPLLSDVTTRLIVTNHERSLKLINGAVDGWPALVYQSLDTLSKQLLPAEKSLLGRYFDLGLATLKGFLP